jgi:methionyl-tRNA formyltransferase
MEIAFFGTGDFSKNILEDLIKDFSAEIKIKLIVSQIDKPI